jgi:hypothetical protein
VKELWVYSAKVRQQIEHEIHMALRDESYKPSPGQMQDHVNNRVAHLASEIAMAVFAEALPEMLEIIQREVESDEHSGTVGGDSQPQ